MNAKAVLAPSVLDTSLLKKKREECYFCHTKFMSTDNVVTCVICAYRYHGKCVNDGGFNDQDIVRINTRESNFKLVCKFCKSKVQAHQNNELLIDTQGQLKALEQKYDGELKIMVADLASEEVANSNMKRKLMDLERRYDEIKLSNTSENPKYKAAYKVQKEENEANQALVRRLNEKFDSQMKLIAESQAREQEYARRLQEFNTIKTQLEANEKALTALTEENTQQQVIIAQLQRATVSSNLHKSKRPRTESDASNAYYSGNEEVDMDSRNDNINARLDKIEQQQTATNKALQQIFQTLTALPDSRQNVNLPIQQPRGRSSSRKSIGTRNQTAVRPMKQTYAAALTSSTTNPALIRNINITADPDKISTVRASLLTNTAITENGIVAVKRKGKNNFTVFFSNEDGAKKTEQHLQTYYDKDVVVKSVNPVSPMVKVTGIYSIYDDSTDVIEQLKKQNTWMANLDFRCVRDYTVETENGPYMNIILACDLPVQNIFIKKGKCVFGLNSCNIFEYVDVLRCNKCQRFGHFIRECTFTEVCRKCHKQHATNTCTEEVLNKCSNCISENKKGAQYNSRHRTSDERCPLRIERINALKQYYVSNSPSTKN